jgi:hypothetical protein
LSGARPPERPSRERGAGDGAPQEVTIMSDFVYLYRGGERPTAPEAMQQNMQKWMKWMKQLADTGHLKERGHPLEREGKLVTGKSRAVTDGVFAETKDVINGFTLIQARDLGQAVELSSGCPILDVGGVVEVRPIMQMNM